MWNKYFKISHPTITTGRGASHVCRKMIIFREEVEHNIWWQIKVENSNFWFDNWTKLGAFLYIESDMAIVKEVEVRDFTTNGGWNE